MNTRYRIVRRWDCFVVLKSVYRDGRWWRNLGDQTFFATMQQAVEYVRQKMDTEAAA